MARDRNKLISTFIQKNGPRKDQSFRIKRGKSGKAIRIYESGDTALAGSGQAVDTAIKAKRKRYGL